MRYALITIVGFCLFLIVGGCAQPTDLTRGEIESRIARQYEFEDKYLDVSD